jgi:hypothetical protein
MLLTVSTAFTPKDLTFFYLELNPKGSYVVIVWGFMTFKWALFVLISSRKFHKQYSEMEGNEAVIAIND